VTVRLPDEDDASGGGYDAAPLDHHGGGDVQSAPPLGGRGGEPERRLMLAVLIDAIHGYQRGREGRRVGAPGRAWRAERSWLRSEDRSSPFSFTNICDALGLDPGYVRRRVLGAAAEGRRMRVWRKPNR
jgi:hypothetical protein